MTAEAGMVGMTMADEEDTDIRRVMTQFSYAVLDHLREIASLLVVRGAVAIRSNFTRCTLPFVFSVLQA